MQTYSSLREKHSNSLIAIKNKYNNISTLRLILAFIFIICLSLYNPYESPIALFGLITSFMAFFVLVKIHQKVAWERNYYQALVTINEDEINFLEKKAMPFDNGKEFIDPSHMYSHDLDIFGNNSLFQYLNRTATHMGKTRLAELLKSILPNKEIKENHEAIKELAQKIEWRQDMAALSKISSDSREDYDTLCFWATSPAPAPSKSLRYISTLLPFLLGCCLLVYLFTDQNLWGNLIILLFVSNLLIFTAQLKKIKEEVKSTSKIYRAIHKYSSIIACMEKEEFHSSKLQRLKRELLHNDLNVSEQVKKLGSLFHQMDSMDNALGAIFANGILLYHLHVFRVLNTWKQEYGEHIIHWLQIIGEMEAMNSLANFYYNNPSYTFPKLNESHCIDLKDVGHPLIKSETRVNNSITFDEHRFVILTGSNMSGKSTFLRTLGVNMVLAGAGAPVCASEANIHPMDVLVSMRLSDSLEESESYFFAEVKRLKQITDKLDHQICFVLLDEILRGTNSDDKRSGTIGIIQKMVQNKAVGVIATHDIEVCLVTNKHENILSNMCFEVEIIDDDLIFDYKLRKGVCQNKSATFLMKKMGII